MGHILGFGTLWGGDGLTADYGFPNLVIDGLGIDPMFIGPNALQAYRVEYSELNAVGVPLEDEKLSDTGSAQYQCPLLDRDSRSLRVP